MAISEIDNHGPKPNTVKVYAEVLGKIASSKTNQWHDEEINTKHPGVIGIEDKAYDDSRKIEEIHPLAVNTQDSQGNDCERGSHRIIDFTQILQKHHLQGTVK